MEYIFNNRTEIFTNVYFASIISFLILEQLIPLRASIGDHGWIRWFNNIFLAGLNMFLARFLFPVSTVAIAMWAEENQYGVFNNFESPLLIQIIVSFIVIDLIGYSFHRLLHTYSMIWRFHLVHHSDVTVDVTTSVRHHPVEIVLSSIPIFIVIILLGAPAICVLLYGIARFFVSIFSHANIRLPSSLERIINFVIVTPDFHRVHHSSDKTKTNSNYSEVFPWWDYMFSTYQPHDKDQESMSLGLEYFRSNRDQVVDGLITQPFRYTTVQRESES